MASLAAIAERDGWRCWLCDEPVPAAARPGDPNAPTLDHVLPRSKGGRREPGNLRLAHRRCNHRRHSQAPQLAWPARFGRIDGPELWQSLRRLHRRGGREVVALLPSEELAEEAARWVEGRAAALFGGGWSAAVELLGSVPAVRLARAQPPV
jgi:hypothetical protein